MAVPLARADLPSRRKRVVAKVIFRGMDLYERLTSRLPESATGPADDLFYRQPETWTYSAPARCSMLGPSRSECSAAGSRPMPGR